MKRRLVTLAAAASLVLCVATVALWVRSYWRYGTVSYVSMPRRVLVSQADQVFKSRSMGWRASSGRGRISIGRFDVFPDTPGYEGRGLMWRASPWDKRPWIELAPKWQRFGVRYWREVFSSGGLTFVGMSHWHIMVPPAALLCVCAIARGPTWRLGRCRACGYDLRATPGRCPECGAVPAATEVA